MPENMDRKNSEYGHFSRGDNIWENMSETLNSFIRVTNLYQILSKKQFYVYISLVPILNHSRPYDISWFDNRFYNKLNFPAQTIETSEQCVKFVQINNKDTRTTSITSFWCLYCKLWTYFTPCSCVSIVNFAHVIAGRDIKHMEILDRQIFYFYFKNL